MNNLKCPNCDKLKIPWFSLCFDCNKKEIEKPSCEVCSIEVPEGHHLCSKHWREKKEEEKNLKQTSFVGKQKQDNHREKFEGRYHSPFGKVKSKGELLIAYFLHFNGLKVHYEMKMEIDSQIVRPDFLIEDGKGNYIILEHFGSENSNKNWKVPLYNDFCKKNKEYFFIYTIEEDLFNLKDNLGTKFNVNTPLKKACWI